MPSGITACINLPKFTIEDRSEYATGTSVRGPLLGPSDSFQCRFLVFPNGTRSVSEERGQREERSQSSMGETLLSAFVEFVPPSHLTEKWECKNVWYSITLLPEKAGSEPIKKWDTFTFSNERADRGWHDWFNRVRDPTLYTGREKKRLTIQGEVQIPWQEHQRASAWQESFRQLDFSGDAKLLTLRLADKTSLLFDPRLLTARSEYFRRMLSSAAWEESRTAVIDLSSDAQATSTCMSAILHFVLTNSFDSEDLDTSMAVRELADRFCMSGLVEQVDAELLRMLTDGNVLEVLGRTLDTGSKVEAACWKMLEEDRSILLKQASKLDLVIAENPVLARKLILFGREH